MSEEYAQKQQQLETLINMQVSHREVLERIVTNYKKTGKDRKTKAYYEKRLKEFEEYWNEFKTRHTEIVRIRCSEKKMMAEKYDYFEKEVFHSMDEFYVNSYALIKERYDAEYPENPPFNNTMTSETSSLNVDERPRHPSSSIRLPKISLEKFDGDYKKWPTFHDLFKSLIHENMMMSPVEKLQYLKLHLSGEAENLVRHFLVTESNYAPAWLMLNERYDNKRVLVNTHIKTLFAQNHLSQESAYGIKSLLDTTTECLQALDNMLIPTSNWDVLIVYMIVQRLPSETHQLWEQSLANQRDLPSWNQLKEFLNGRFRTLEALSMKRGISGARDIRNPHHVQRSSPQTFYASTGIICCICGEAHTVRQCARLRALSPYDREQMVKGKGLCFNCLGTGHVITNCPSQQRCSQCKRKHHSMLHRNQTDFRPHDTQRNSNYDTFPENDHANVNTAMTQYSEPQRQATLSASSTTFVPQSNDAVHTFNTQIAHDTFNRHEVLLATAKVRIVAPNGSERIVRALIDQGSEASFVTQEIVEALQLPKGCVRTHISGIGQSVSREISSKVHLSFKALHDDSVQIEAIGLVLDKLTNCLPSKPIHPQEWEHIKGLQLADPEYFKPGKIDLLLGADVYHRIIQQGLIRGKQGTPIAQCTSLGWILSGEIIDDQVVNEKLSACKRCHEQYRETVVGHVKVICQNQNPYVALPTSHVKNYPHKRNECKQKTLC